MGFQFQAGGQWMLLHSHLISASNFPRNPEKNISKEQTGKGWGEGEGEGRRYSQQE